MISVLKNRELYPPLNLIIFLFLNRHINIFIKLIIFGKYECFRIFT